MRQRATAVGATRAGETAEQPTAAWMRPSRDAGPCIPEAESCNGADDDCNGEIDEGGVCPVSCLDAIAHGDPTTGVHAIRPATEIVDVYCDMDTDDGGWTLVASTLDTPLLDEASGYYDDLSTLAPASGHDGVWDDLRDLAATFDLRFACRDGDRAADSPFDVDLSFYDVIWYHEITTGPDADCCFSEGDGVGADPPPARRNNIADVFLDAGNTWDAAGYLEGEDQCDDTGDFTIDFDNRGMDSDEDDGTDWGADDDSLKCGVSGLSGGQWFIFARER